ncbi:MAG: peptidase [Planctomyces sp.]|nr:peptidase [Planctomyces sp.]
MTVESPLRHVLPAYRTVWRWHFYAALFTIPFIVILSLSGIVYLFKAEIEDWLDRPYDNLTSASAPAPLVAQIQAAVASLPSGRFVSYELPRGPGTATRIVVRHGEESSRVYIHPQSLAVLQTVVEKDRLMRQVFRIHGELMLGDPGSYLVELAASWTIVMILTGLYLWWPRHLRSLAGVLYPRLGGGRRMLLRDLHSVTGVWISLFALLLLVSGLPWSRFWGDYFREVRRVTGTAVARQEWSNRAEGAAPSATSSGGGEHAGHAAGSAPARTGRRGGRGHAAPVSPATLEQLEQLDVVVRATQPLGLAHPVIIAPPGGESSGWTVKSMTANRPYRETLTIDGKKGEVLSREGFADRHWIDRVVSIGIAVHEGRLFGWPNQLLGLLTALGLILLSCTGPIMWWRRRAPGSLGAPSVSAIPMRSDFLFAIPFLAFVTLLGICLPLFGASLLAVLLIERVVLRNIPAVSRWLGLRTTAWATPEPSQVS